MRSSSRETAAHFQHENRHLCRIGIPRSMRSRVWRLLIHQQVADLKAKHGEYYYRNLCSSQGTPAEKHVSTFGGFWKLGVDVCVCVREKEKQRKVMECAVFAVLPKPPEANQPGPAEDDAQQRALHVGQLQRGSSVFGVL